MSSLCSNHAISYIAHCMPLSLWSMCTRCACTTRTSPVLSKLQITWCTKTEKYDWYTSRQWFRIKYSKKTEEITENTYISTNKYMALYIYTPPYIYTRAGTHKQYRQTLLHLLLAKYQTLFIDICNHHKVCTTTTDNTWTQTAQIEAVYTHTKVWYYLIHKINILRHTDSCTCTWMSVLCVFT